MEYIELNENNKKVFAFLKEHFPGDWQAWISNSDPSYVTGFQLNFSYFYLQIYTDHTIDIFSLGPKEIPLFSTFRWIVRNFKDDEIVRTFHNHEGFKIDKIFTKLEALIKELPAEYRNELKIELFELALLNEQIRHFQAQYDSHRKTLDYYEEALNKATERRLVLEQAKIDRQTIIKTLIELGRGILEEEAKQSTEAPEADLLLADPKIPKKHSKPNRKARRASKPIPRNTK